MPPSHDYPFDLQTDRFLLYDPAKPEASVAKLTAAITATLGTVRTASGADSPVYKMLPSLPEPSPTALRVVPQDFREAVDYAAAKKEYGDLRLLAHEAAWFEWASEGLRTVGRAQFGLGAWPRCPRHVRVAPQAAAQGRRDQPAPGHDLPEARRPRSLEPGDPARDRCAGRVVATTGPRRSRCRDGTPRRGGWRSSAGLSGVDAQKAALRAPELKDAIERCGEGFEQDLNHFYSGLNALSLLQIRNSLAAAVPDVWGEPFETDDDAARELSQSRARFERLANAVEMSIAARETFLSHQQPEDTEQLMWAAISRADHAFLTGRKPAAVATRYRDALADASQFARVVSARTARDLPQARRQERVRRGVARRHRQPDRARGPASKESASAKATPPDRVLLFTGHMVDSTERKTPRFPRTPAAEAAAREMIKASIERERQLEPGRLVGVAGGACGGDILFHEICEELGIETRLLLALPQGKFSAESVQHGDRDWVERYNRLCYRVRPRVLAEDEDAAGVAEQQGGLSDLVAQQPVDAVQRAGARRAIAHADCAVGRRPG